MPARDADQSARLESPDRGEIARQLLAGRDGPERPLHYLFAHVAVRRAVFDNHPEVPRLLAGDGPFAFTYCWARTSMLCEDAGLTVDEDWNPFDEMAVTRYMWDGWTVHVLAMPEARHGGEAHLVGIAHRDGEPREDGSPSPGTRYFTLEMSSLGGGAFLGEWFRDDTRRNHGEGPPPDPARFAARVFELLAGPPPTDPEVAAEARAVSERVNAVATAPGRTVAHTPAAGGEESRFWSLLGRWQAAHDAGQELAVRELCPDDPALADRLAAAVDKLRKFNPPTAAPAADTAVPTAVPGYTDLRELARGAWGWCSPPERWPSAGTWPSSCHWSGLRPGGRCSTGSGRSPSSPPGCHTRASRRCTPWASWATAGRSWR